MQNVIEYSNNCSKTSGILWQCCKDKPVVDVKNAINDFNEANGANSSNNKNKRKGRQQCHNRYWSNGTLEYLCILWITFEMPLINCRLNLDLNWSNECFILATAVAD